MPKKDKHDKTKGKSPKKEEAPVVETAQPTPPAKPSPQPILKTCGTCKNWKPRATRRGPCPIKRAQMNESQTCGKWEGM